MKESKKKALEKRGWSVGSAKDFLKMTDEEAALIELKLSLAENLKTRRQKSHLSQEQLAKLLDSSQSRVAKMEACDRSVSIELLLRALLRLGATRRQLGAIISKAA